MELVVLTCLTLFAGIHEISAQGCPGNANECMVQGGFRSFPSDPWHICTTSIKELLSAFSCIQRCRYQVPDQLNRNIAYVDQTCSAMRGCENYVEKMKDFTSCFTSHSSLSGLVTTVITLFNSRLPNDEECLDLRSRRNCMKAWTRSCAYLDYYYRSFIEPISKLDLALYVCGAENVVSRHSDYLCSEQLYQQIESSCNVACQLAGAATAGDFCRTLQSQADCIEGYSGGCSQARSKLLLPRIDTYAFINQIFSCNITVMGVLAKPSDHTECNFKKALSKCYKVHEPNKMTFKDVQKYVNSDFFTTGFCGNLGNRADQEKDCTKAYWSCTVPLTGAFKKLPSLYSLDFRFSLGAFPLNNWGLKHAFDSCNAPPHYRPRMICERPGYNAIRSTTLLP